MRLPTELLEAIQQETDRVDRRRLVQATAQLSEHYKSADFSTPAISSEAHRAAYLAVRLPATYAAIQRVLSEIKQRAPQAEINSLLDIGSGPGTALFAANEEFSLQQATLIEVDSEWLTLGKRLAAQSQSAVVKEAQWLKQDLRSGFSCPAHDLVVISYTLGELSRAAADAVLRKAWSCARRFLVVIEPGTPRGFSVVNTARTSLIGIAESGNAGFGNTGFGSSETANAARIIAPCPHQNACPMAVAGDWCHFSQRVERSSLHRQLKGGTLGYEDEKFSYLIAAKTIAAIPNGSPALSDGNADALPAVSRVVRHPGKHSGHVKLSLCTPQGQIESRTIARSNKSAYKLARKAEWGDTWME
jgi:ribosomal protein RSM22 (predicted rRNA methylase)